MRSLRSLAGSRLVYVASSGGHLAELRRLDRYIRASSDSTWVTFDLPQARSMLGGCSVNFVPYVAPRDWLSVLRLFFYFAFYFRQNRPAAVVSTGAALAISSHAAAAIWGIPAIYIESVGRVSGPSLTGRMMRLLPGVETFTQNNEWKSAHWHFEHSVLDDFRGVALETKVRQSPTIFVTLGTIRPYRFDRLVDRLLLVCPPTWKWIWQLGSTVRLDLPGESYGLMTEQEFRIAVDRSDLVISHAGVGTTLDLLERGVAPLVVARSAAFREHVDDHQQEIVRELRARNFVACRDAASLTLGCIETALTRRVEPLVPLQ